MVGSLYGPATHSCTRNSWFGISESVIRDTCHTLVRVRKNLEGRQLQFKDLSNQKLFSASNPVSFSAYLYFRIMYRCSHSVLLGCFPNYLCDLHDTEISIPAGAGSILCHSHSIAIYSRWTGAICPFFVDRSLTNQQIENYHVTKLLVSLRSFELSTRNMYDSVKTPLVWTPELVNFEFFARFVQITQVCGRALTTLLSCQPYSELVAFSTFQSCLKII